MEADELVFVVAEIDGDIVAFGSLKLATSGAYEAHVDAEATGVYGHPSVARQGVGTRIYTELERRARTRDAQMLGLSASPNAAPFYEAHGYERVSEYTHEFSTRESTGAMGTVVAMKKKL